MPNYDPNHANLHHLREAHALLAEDEPLEKPEHLLAVTDAIRQILEAPNLVARMEAEGSVQYGVYAGETGRFLGQGFHRAIKIDHNTLPNIGNVLLDMNMEPGATQAYTAQGFSDVPFNPQPGSDHKPDEPNILDSPDEILEATYRHWDFSPDVPLVTPKGNLRCLCGGTEWHPRYWLYHDYANQMMGRQEKHRLQYRCDISLKCKECAFVGVWGLVVPPEWWEKFEIKDVKITWQEASRMLESLQSTQEE